ncbi:LMBR1 domain-containing protein 2-B [Olea europaea subsp. europaea]|uniref:LMBR1 domain-containing protein 2-B n=1 Tax=Olea europaea subsp. europaea TaxID=158383 RepID=A0A8S0SZL0_OLEEU|nr:LMBR1 domain-containing protein 2-B [Olea europaea subsp. europaea]
MENGKVKIIEEDSMMEEYPTCKHSGMKNWKIAVQECPCQLQVSPSSSSKEEKRLEHAVEDVPINRLNQEKKSVVELERERKEKEITENSPEPVIFEVIDEFEKHHRRSSEIPTPAIRDSMNQMWVRHGHAAKEGHRRSYSSVSSSREVVGSLEGSVNGLQVLESILVDGIQQGSCREEPMLEPQGLGRVMELTIKDRSEQTDESAVILNGPQGRTNRTVWGPMNKTLVSAGATKYRKKGRIDICIVKSDYTGIAQATSKQMSKRDPLRPLMDIIDNMLVQMFNLYFPISHFKEDPSFKPQGGRLGENDMDYDSDEKSMAILRRHLRQACEEYYRCKSEYLACVTETLELEDTIKNYERRDTTGWKYVSSFRSERTGKFGPCLDTIELVWRCILWKQLKKVFAVILGCMSVAILLAEATLLLGGVDLSLFSVLIKSVGNEEVVVQVFAFVPLMYMCVCTY